LNEKGLASKEGCPDGGVQLSEGLKLSESSNSLEPPEPFRNRKSGLEMVAVEGGTYIMGSLTTQKDRAEDECQHSVTVCSFNIGKYEVTQADWQEIMGNNPSYFNKENCTECPVEQVSWDDTQEFLKKLNARYSGRNYRLPTEEEWEFAARGGKSSKGYIYSGDNLVGNVAWYEGNSGNKTHPVGGRKANELGLYDMSGNVWEWCADTYKPYPECSGKENSSINLRGAGWSSYYVYPLAKRAFTEGSLRYHSHGFRLTHD
jgi:formylglycine-generating enzyme required for sulfatase activity